MMVKKNKYQKERITTNRQTMAVEGVIYQGPLFKTINNKWRQFKFFTRTGPKLK